MKHPWCTTDRFTAPFLKLYPFYISFSVSSRICFKNGLVAFFKNHFSQLLPPKPPSKPSSHHYLYLYPHTSIAKSTKLTLFCDVYVQKMYFEKWS